MTAASPSSERIGPAIGLTPAGALAVLLLLAFAIIAVAGPLLSPFDPTAIGAGMPFEPPSVQHLLGTDNFGRDVFSRIVAGTRPALATGLAATALAVVAGTALGLWLACRRGIADEIVARLLDMVISMPPLIMALLAVSVFGSYPLLVVLTVAVLFAPRVARVVRAAALSVVTEDYVTAAVLRGESNWTIALRELLPNVAGTVFVEFSIRTGYAIVMIGSLSFLGFGSPPPTPEWGLMINEGYATVSASIWPVLAPAAAMALLVTAVNLFTEDVARLIGHTSATKGRL
jgi:peptide/nickel transport system permease protein